MIAAGEASINNVSAVDHFPPLQREFMVFVLMIVHQIIFCRNSKGED